MVLRLALTLSRFVRHASMNFVSPESSSAFPKPVRKGAGEESRSFTHSSEQDTGAERTINSMVHRV